MFDIHSIPGEAANAVDWGKLQRDLTRESSEPEQPLLPKADQPPLEVTEADSSAEQNWSRSEPEGGKRDIRNK